MSKSMFIVTDPCVTIFCKSCRLEAHSVKPFTYIPLIYLWIFRPELNYNHIICYTHSLQLKNKLFVKSSNNNFKFCCEGALTKLKVLIQYSVITCMYECYMTNFHALHSTLIKQTKEKRFTFHIVYMNLSLSFSLSLSIIYINFISYSFACG